MPKKAIIFITDEPFLIPTLQAAMQAAEQPAVIERADILVCLTNVSEALVGRMHDAFAETPLQILVMDPAQYDLPAGTTFNKTHVPLTTLARLSISATLPDRYDSIIYLDGDIQITGDLVPLVDYDVAPGRIAAASEAAWIYKGEMGRYWPFIRSYMAGLGIEDPLDYFNAGVLLFRRSTWDDFAPRAKDFFIRNSERCLYHDQSALNAVFLGRRDVLSPRWNFVSGYAKNADFDIDALRVIHFTGGEKPWNCSSPPWNGRFLSSYTDLLAHFPVLAPVSQHIKPRTGEIRQHGLARWPAQRPTPPWRRYFRNMRIQRYLRDATFALR